MNNKNQQPHQWQKDTTSIWIDFYEDRKGYNNEPLGNFAWKLLALMLVKKNKIIISDLLISELKIYYSDDQINGMIRPFEELTEKIIATREQRDESEIISKKRNVPRGDALHSIIARDNSLVLVTRDNHFNKLDDISRHYKPEDLI